MKNTIISIFLFISIMCFVSYCDYSLNKLTIYIEKQTTNIENLLEADNYAEAFELSKTLTNRIKQKRNLLSVYINHCDLDNIIYESIKLNTYIKNQDKSESNTSVHLLNNLSDNINKLHKPTLDNIF